MKLILSPLKQYKFEPTKTHNASLLQKFSTQNRLNYNEYHRHDITGILLKVVLNTITFSLSDLILKQTFTRDISLVSFL